MKIKKVGFEDLAAIYDHPSIILFRGIELRAIYNCIKNINFSNPALDLGCGDGSIAALLFNEHFQYGIDNGEAKDVENAINKGIYQHILLESAEKISLHSSCVNFVFSNCVIEHIPDNNAVLSEVSRILKPGGAFVFTVPSDKFPDYLYLTNKFASLGLSFLSKFYKYRRNKMLNQFHCYSIKDWEGKLSNFGFEIVTYKYYMPKESLMLWDSMALKIFALKLLHLDFSKKILNRNHSKILNSINDQEIGEDGAALCIYCVKKST